MKINKPQQKKNKKLLLGKFSSPQMTDHSAGLG
jgi:hypothetical protein